MKNIIEGIRSFIKGMKRGVQYLSITYRLPVWLSVVIGTILVPINIIFIIIWSMTSKRSIRSIFIEINEDVNHTLEDRDE